MSGLSTVDVSLPSPMSSGLTLPPAAPNPFRREVRIDYTLPTPGRVRITIHDVSGRTIATLVDAVEPAGSRVARWSGRDASGRPAPAGLYVVRLDSGGATLARRITRIH